MSICLMETKLRLKKNYRIQINSPKICKVLVEFKASNGMWKANQNVMYPNTPVQMEMIERMMITANKWWKYLEF